MQPGGCHGSRARRPRSHSPAHAATAARLCGGGVPPGHGELPGASTSNLSSSLMIVEKLRQPGTARARGCQAVRSGGLRARGGMDTPARRWKRMSTGHHQRRCHRQCPYKQRRPCQGLYGTQTHLLAAAHQSGEDECVRGVRSWGEGTRTCCCFVSSTRTSSPSCPVLSAPCRARPQQHRSRNERNDIQSRPGAWATASSLG